MRILQFSHYPVVQWSVILELQCTKGMAHALNGILNRMRKIVHWINAPLISCIMMGHMRHTVDHRVTHVNIR